jgi:diacylglycerol O-acyltransferase / wax synthase
MRQLTSMDAQFLNLESARMFGHVSGLAMYDPSTAPGGHLDASDLCRLVGERIHLIPPFTWKLAPVPFGLDHPYWVEDEDFDLDFHIRELALPPGADDRKLAEQVARIVARPLDRAHPLWELYVVHNVPGDQVALLTKVHHAAIDGVSGAEILTALLDLEPTGRQVPERTGNGHLRRPSTLEMLGRGVVNAPLQPLRAALALPDAAQYAAGLPSALALPGTTRMTAAARTFARVFGRVDPDVLEETMSRTPRTIFNGRISPHRRFAFGQVPLQTVKNVKNSFGITVNDVVVATCAGALRSWLTELDELPADPLVAMVPVSVRTPEEKGTFGNRVSAMIVPIPTDEAEPIRRLRRTHDILAAAKTQHSAISAHTLQDASRFIPPAVNAQAARLAFRVSTRLPSMNLVISNVPGPRIPLYCAGARLTANYPVSVITDGVGLNITVQSYLDHLDFGLVADRRQIEDIWPLMDHLRAALGEYAALA